MRRPAPVFLNKCSVTGVDVMPPKRYECEGRDKASWRRKRLRQGITRWHKSVCDRARPIESVQLLALTCTEADPAVAQGAIMRFWKGMRAQYPGLEYFSWLELQRRGAPHYHAIILNPPWRTRGEAVARMRRLWPLASITPNLQIRPGSWFVRAGGRYVTKYAQKTPAPGAVRSAGGNDKRYQQAYEEIPRELRTFQHNLLEHRMAAIDEHLDQADWSYLPASSHQGVYFPATVSLVRNVLHTCGAAHGNIPLRRVKRRLPRSSKSLGSQRRNGVTTTAAPLPG